MTKLGQVECEIAVSMVEALVEYGLISHLASSGERSTED